MSCFVMNEKRIAILAIFIADMLNFPGEYQLSLPEGIYQFADCDNPDDPNFFDEKKIYEKLYRFNIEAYRERYGCDPEAFDDTVPDFRSDRSMIPPRIWTVIEIEGRKRGIYTIVPGHYAILKTFDCFLYQTNEGIYTDCDFRKELKTLRNGLQSFIIHNTPEYIIAPWN